MKFIFLVQGEGRGHMTQAITLSKILNSNGHEVVHTFVGKSGRRSIPEYFFDQMESRVEAINSPNFILDKENKSLNLVKSITSNAKFLGIYKKSLDQIRRKVKNTRPDAIINFYDFLGGFYFRFYNPTNVKHICIGRQFLTLHPNYPFESGREVEKKLYLTNNKITSQKCNKYLALSFRPYDPIRFNNVIVVPPLIKEEIKQLNVIEENFILGYIVNDGYAEDVKLWQSGNSDTKVHCFWDRKNMPDHYSPQKNLTFHQINHAVFTDMMRRCKAFVSTAGFESICEAMYMNKPAMMIPVDGQYEQACNAIDAEISGAGIKASKFNITQLLDYLPNYKPNIEFKQWADKTESIFLEELTNFS